LTAARAEASEADAVRAATAAELVDMQSQLAATQAELGAMRAEREASARELSALRALLPPAEGGSLDLESARAAAAEHAETLRAAHLAMRNRGADREALQKTIDAAAAELRRAQALVARIQGGTLYEVRPGETLGGLSGRFYNQANTWPRVYQANQHVLENPDQVWPGTTLILP
ncbi:MAG: LysM peptidoglycan-binding domain-containing protein, partial [Thioalkalivibrio sp.]|nr:LysM peptidoglycan-binding domain-containing protein [Thioalkalivibrio sp.]